MIMIIDIVEIPENRSDIQRDRRCSLELIAQSIRDAFTVK